MSLSVTREASGERKKSARKHPVSRAYGIDKEWQLSMTAQVATLEANQKCIIADIAGVKKSVDDVRKSNRNWLIGISVFIPAMIVLIDFVRGA